MRRTSTCWPAQCPSQPGTSRKRLLARGVSGLGSTSSTTTWEPKTSLRLERKVLPADGVYVPPTAYTDDDFFQVYSNKAELDLNGNEGDDTFQYRVCNTDDRCDVATVFTATPPVDLEVTITRRGPSLSAGDRATYDVTVTNL